MSPSQQCQFLTPSVSHKFLFWWKKFRNCTVDQHLGEAQTPDLQAKRSNDYSLWLQSQWKYLYFFLGSHISMLEKRPNEVWWLLITHCPECFTRTLLYRIRDWLTVTLVRLLLSRYFNNLIQCQDRSRRLYEQYPSRSMMNKGKLQCSG